MQHLACFLRGGDFASQLARDAHGAFHELRIARGEHAMGKVDVDFHADADIAAEEEQVGVVDLTRPEYPLLARKLRARRDNLLETVGQLRQRLV